MDTTYQLKIPLLILILPQPEVQECGSTQPYSGQLVNDPREVGQNPQYEYVTSAEHLKPEGANRDLLRSPFP